MKTKIYLLFAWATLAEAGCSAENTPSDDCGTTSVETPDEPQKPVSDKKVLIVFFSHTLLAQAREEVAAGYCPPLKTPIERIAG